MQSEILPIMHNTDEIIQWLQNWVYSDYEKQPNMNPEVNITTIDNPGWGVAVKLKDKCSISKRVLEDVEVAEDDWYYCAIKNGEFQGDGGVFNLTNIVSVFKNLVTAKNGSQMNINHQEMTVHKDLEWLLHWYARQCDGDWEHGNGVRIYTLDNPGWSFSVNLEDTELEVKKFIKLEMERSENDWLVCFIRDKKFEGRCGPGNLLELLHIFRKWAESFSED